MTLFYWRVIYYRTTTAMVSKYLSIRRTIHMNKVIDPYFWCELMWIHHHENESENSIYLRCYIDFPAIFGWTAMPMVSITMYTVVCSIFPYLWMFLFILYMFYSIYISFCSSIHALFSIAYYFLGGRTDAYEITSQRFDEHKIICWKDLAISTSLIGRASNSRHLINVCTPKY